MVMSVMRRGFWMVLGLGLAASAGAAVTVGNGHDDQNPSFEQQAQHQGDGQDQANQPGDGPQFDIETHGNPLRPQIAVIPEPSRGGLLMAGVLCLPVLVRSRLRRANATR
jgi:hypothetical protein